MVDGESKATLRSAVLDGLLEYRRTCDTADAEGVEVHMCVCFYFDEVCDTFVASHMGCFPANGKQPDRPRPYNKGVS